MLYRISGNFQRISLVQAQLMKYKIFEVLEKIWTTVAIRENESPFVKYTTLENNYLYNYTPCSELAHSACRGHVKSSAIKQSLQQFHYKCVHTISLCYCADILITTPNRLVHMLSQEPPSIQLHK